MIDPVLILVLSSLLGGLCGFTAAVIYIKSRQQHLDDRALSLRKAARRLENANKLQSSHLALNRGYN